MPIFILLFLVTAQLVSAETALKQFEKIPHDFYLAEIPNIPRSGPFRLSWGFYRVPVIWLQGEVVDISKLRWPQFDKEQVPPSISPDSSMRSYVLIEDANGKLIETLKLDKPFTPDSYSNKNQPPSRYRIQMEAIPDRLILTTKSYPWFRRKEIFKCDVLIAKNDKLQNNSRVNNCLQTLTGLTEKADRQWYVKIEWPEREDNEHANFISEKERSLKGLFRKSNHIYQSEKLPTRRFLARAGITNSELISNIEFEYSEINNRDLLSEVPDKQSEKKTLDQQVLKDGSKVEAISYPGDYVEVREALTPIPAKPQVHIQFIPAKSDQYLLRKTAFHEIHTGLGGMLRPWQGSFFADFNNISSNRGERNSFFDLPGFEVSYKSNYWNLVPYGFYQTGLIHSGSSLAISELQVGFRRPLARSPQLSPYLGVHQYTLSGENPGTSRLGKMNAFVFGMQASQLHDTHVLKGRLGAFYSNTFGYEGLIEYGRLLERTTDFTYYYGIYFGYSRYASTIVNKIQVNETFSEDRLRMGLSFGFLGPESL